jgi:hypothetical protein
MKKKENDYDSFSKETSEQETEIPFTTFQALARSVANSKDFISSPSLASLDNDTLSYSSANSSNDNLFCNFAIDDEAPHQTITTNTSATDAINRLKISIQETQHFLNNINDFVTNCNTNEELQEINMVTQKYYFNLILLEQLEQEQKHKTESIT